MSPRSWQEGPCPDWRSRPSTHLKSHRLWGNHANHRNTGSCCNIRHRYSLHIAHHSHNHLDAWHHNGCKVFFSWFHFEVFPSSLCIRIWGTWPSLGEGEQVLLPPALPTQKRCQLWHLSPLPWLRSLLREQRIHLVLRLEGLRFPYDFFQHELLDHAASQMQSQWYIIWNARGWRSGFGTATT